MVGLVDGERLTKGDLSWASGQRGAAAHIVAIDLTAGRLVARVALLEIGVGYAPVAHGATPAQTVLEYGKESAEKIPKMCQ